MSTVAIISIGCATAGSLALAGALLALGLGLATGFVLSSLKQLGEEDKTGIANEVNTVLYTIRRDIKSMGKGQALTTHMAKLQHIEEQIQGHLKNNNKAGIENSILALREVAAEARKDIELIKIETPVETELVKERISGAIAAIMPDLPQGPLKSEAEALKKEFERVLANGQSEALLDALRSVEARLREVVNKFNLSKGAEVSGALEVFVLDTKQSITSKPALLEDIRKFYSLIQKLDPGVAAEIRPLTRDIEAETYLQRIEMVRNNVKLRYGKLKEDLAWTAVHRDALKKLATRVRGLEGSGEILRSIEAMIGGKYIDKASYDAVLTRVAEFISRAEEAALRKSQSRELAQKVKSGLEGLGYSVISEKDSIERLEQAEIVYLDTKWQDYKVMVRLNEEMELVTRLVKIVPEEIDREQIPSYEKQKDNETAKQWCKDYDKFLASLDLQGIGFNVKLRKEPVDEEVLYVVNKELASRKSEKADVRNEMKRRMDG